MYIFYNSLINLPRAQRANRRACCSRIPLSSSWRPSWWEHALHKFSESVQLLSRKSGGCCCSCCRLRLCGACRKNYCWSTETCPDTRKGLLQLSLYCMLYGFERLNDKKHFNMAKPETRFRNCTYLFNLRSISQTALSPAAFLHVWSKMPQNWFIYPQLCYWEHITTMQWPSNVFLRDQGKHINALKCTCELANFINSIWCWIC